VLNDRITSSAQTQCRHDFREGVVERDDQLCIITQEPAEDHPATQITLSTKEFKSFKFVLVLHVIQKLSSLFITIQGPYGPFYTFMAL
jgi:hypothetical protein